MRQLLKLLSQNPVFADSPEYQRKLRRLQMRVVSRLQALAVLAVIVLSLAACGSPATNAEISDTVKKVGGAYDGMAEGARPFDRAMVIGQVVVVSDKADVTLQSVGKDVQGWAAAGAGNEVIVLDLTLVNRSGVDLNLKPLTQFQLADLANNQYPALEVKGFEPLVAGNQTLAPGASTRGQISFSIPTDSRHLGLVWTQIAPAVLIVDGLEAG
jgi:hypothetical protein